MWHNFSGVGMSENSLMGLGLHIKIKVIENSYLSYIPKL